MKQIIREFSDNIQDAMKLKIPSVKGTVDKIFICGIGGSAITGDILRDYLIDHYLPVFIVRGYKLPAYVDKKSLVFIISYSGNTEETIELYKKCKEKKTKIFILAGGGYLAKEKNIIHIPHKIPRSRGAFAYMFFPVLKILAKMNIIRNQDRIIKDTIKSLKSFKTGEAKRIADKLYKKIPVIYSSERYKGVVYRWKTQLNENSKILAISNIFPKLNHDELSGFINAGKQGDFHIIMLKDIKEDRRLLERMKLTEELIKNTGCGIMNVSIKGSTFLEKLMYAIHTGDWASYFLAEKYGINALDVSLQESIKKKMQKEL